MPLAKPSRFVLALSALCGPVIGVGLAWGFGVRDSALDPAPPHCVVTPAALDASLPKASYGEVRFANSCAAAVQPALQLEIARLHSFESDSGRFSAIARRDPRCAIAWWGAAMSARGNPLGGSLGEEDRRTGRAFADKALALKTGTPRETALIAAMDIYYRPYADQIARARSYADAMDTAYAASPDDPDIAALDGLAIIEGVDLSDKTFARQKRAGAILEHLMATHPDHPGAPHYLIHAYDYTALAPLAAHAAALYPTLATASSHAQHMPSHIWSMLGAWDKSIHANRVSGALIDPEAGQGTVRGDIVFDHAFDFIAYARLQRGEDKHVAADVGAKAADGKAPVIVQARYPLERGDWAGAAALAVPKADAFDIALARFTRAYGAARAGDAAKAAVELDTLEAMRPRVRSALGDYWAVFVDIYAKTARAWLAKAQGKPDEALALMREAASMDDGHEKHIYLENKILPMRESLGDMLAELGHYAEALAAYQESLTLAPNRYRAFLGAARAAEAAGDIAAARAWYAKLVDLAEPGDKARPDLATARVFLAAHG